MVLFTFTREKRRMSLISSIADDTNDNFHQASQNDRRRSAQSILGVGISSDDRQMCFSGQRSVEGAALIQRSSDDGVPTSTQHNKVGQVAKLSDHLAHESDLDKKHQKESSDTKVAASLSVPDSLVVNAQSSGAGEVIPEKCTLGVDPTNAFAIKMDGNSGRLQEILLMRRVYLNQKRLTNRDH